jgi:hypothetical protein
MIENNKYDYRAKMAERLLEFAIRIFTKSLVTAKQNQKLES